MVSTLNESTSQFIHTHTAKAWPSLASYAKLLQGQLLIIVTLR